MPDATFAQTVVAQIQEHSQALQVAAAIGSVVSLTWAFFQSWRRSERRLKSRYERNLIAMKPVFYRARSVERHGGGVDILAQAEIGAKEGVTLSDIHTLIRSESRKNFIYGFLQNLFFFVLGTVTSVIAQGYFP
jgi:hypothetical protein